MGCFENREWDLFKERPKVLFLGNGLNLCINGNASWKKIILEICEQYKVGSFNETPLNMVFEIVANKKENFSDINADVFNQLKTEISKKIQDKLFVKSELHQIFTSLGFDAYITTNYDYMIEYALDEKFEPSVKNRRINGNLKYMFTEANVVNDKKIYHIHGENLYPKTLCLGYEHYIGVVQRLRKDIHSNFIEENHSLELFNKNHYAYMFFFSDIYFVGFGLDYSEIDIWWLLNYRKKLVRNAQVNNRLVFYDIAKKENIEKKQLMESFDVEWRFCQIDNDSQYEQVYRNIASEIRGDMKI